MEIPVLLYNRTVGTHGESVSRERKNRCKRGRRMAGKSAMQTEDVMRSELISSEAGELAAGKSRYSVYCTRTVNRHRWMRRES